jgi:hypothetical protein
VFTFGVPALAALTFVGIAREQGLIFLSQRQNRGNSP